MSEEKINSFLCLFVDEDEIARIEAENIAHDESSPSFDSVGALMQELLDE